MIFYSSWDTEVSYVPGLSAFLQALHFFIGFGALVSPLIADPFLSESGCGNHTGNETVTMHHFRNMLRNSPIAEHNITTDPLPHEGVKEESIVHYAFWIMALINVRYCTADEGRSSDFEMTWMQSKTTEYLSTFSCPCPLQSCFWCIGSSWSHAAPAARRVFWIRMNWQWRTSRGLRVQMWSRRNMKLEVKTWHMSHENMTHIGNTSLATFLCKRQNVVFALHVQKWIIHALRIHSQSVWVEKSKKTKQYMPFCVHPCVICDFSLSHRSRGYL